MRFGIYCDESGVTQHRYMAIGGLWVPGSEIVALRERVREVRSTWNLSAEMKWTKVSTAKLDAYKAFVNPAFDLAGVSFRCILLDTTIIDYRQYHQHDAELGFYKFTHLFISRNLVRPNQYSLVLDHRTTRKPYRLQALAVTTNNWCQNKLGCRPVLNVEARDSKDEDLLQLTDVILGAVTAAWNGCTSSEAKGALMTHIARRAGLHTLALPTSYRWRRMNIWLWRPASKQKVRPGS